MLITAAELLAEPERYRVIDCRFTLTDPEHARFAYLTGHIPGASFADLEVDLSAPAFSGVGGRHPLPEPEVFTHWLQASGISPELPVVLYDDAGGAMAAARLWWLLKWAGHPSVMLLDGGLSAWQKAGGRLNAQEPEFERSGWQPRYHHDWVVTTEELQVRLSETGLMLLDARDYRRFLGDPNPLDPVAGHIPGARSYPFTGNLSANGCFLPVEQLRERFVGVQGDVICYCGSGVTACHNLFALYYAGQLDFERSMPRLYAGSWSEWICDASRPVALGDER